MAKVDGESHSSHRVAMWPQVVPMKADQDVKDSKQRTRCDPRHDSLTLDGQWKQVDPSNRKYSTIDTQMEIQEWHCSSHLKRIRRYQTKSSNFEPSWAASNSQLREIVAAIQAIVLPRCL